jgi:divalent metal cation (Fe/Co/Zn/Cd) transporter
VATRSPLTVVLAAMALSTVSTLALFTAAAWTGSSALLAIAIQALIAATSQGFLLHGLNKSPGHKSSGHSGGDAYEMYFWSFAVAVLLFSLGAGIAMYDGVAKLADPLPNRYHHVAFSVLALAFVLTGAATYLALEHASAPRPQAVARTGPRAAQEAAASTIVIEGMAGLLGIAIAAAGIAIAQSLSAPAADGYAAITVGLVLGVVAAFMSLEIRTLLVRTGQANRERPSDFFVDDEPVPEPVTGKNSATQTVITPTVPAQRAAPAKPSTATPAAPPSATPPSTRPMSRKERKRQKGKR